MNYLNMNKKTNQILIIILAAGKGTRMNSDMPKVIHKINDKPMINKVIETARSLAPKDIIAIVGFKKDEVINTINDKNIIYVEQKEQKGTGHAIIQCLSHIQNFSGDVLILSGDVPLITSETLKDFYDFHSKTKAQASLISANIEDPTGYGRVIKNKKNKLSYIVEHKDASNDEKEINEINSGIYIFNSKTLSDNLLKLTNENAQNEYYLTQVFDFMDKDSTYVKNINNLNEIMGINTLEELKIMNKSID